MFLARLMLSSLALAGVLVMGLSSPASAVTNSVTNNGDGTATVEYSMPPTNTAVILCSSGTDPRDCAFSGTNALYTFGDTFDLNAPFVGNPEVVREGMNVEDYSTGNATTLPAGTYVIVLVVNGTYPNPWPSDLFAPNVSITASAPIPSPVSSNAMGPLVQQVPMPVSDTCSEVDDEQFAWGTGLRGGWSKSWAQWANDELGGPVCTRTLVYSGSWRIN
jgi:hypothetical protein